MERSITVALGLVVANIVWREGFNGLSKSVVKFIRLLPGVNAVLNRVLESEVRGATKLLSGGDDKKGAGALKPHIPIPEKGLDAKTLLGILTKLHDSETSAETGRAFAYTYTTSSSMKELSEVLNKSYCLFSEKTGGDGRSSSSSLSHDELLEEAWNLFMHSNALNPMMYPSLRKFETEIVSMTSWMLHGDATTAGSVTSGGTESILMAVKCYRDRAHKLMPHITKPNIIVATTIHPAFEKAGHYFGVELIHVPLTADCRMDVEAASKAINRDTILLVGSASQYCHGVVDPIEKLSDLALKRGIPLHVDACFGGFMLPFLEKLGVKIPLWDFRVQGVTSISADVHKYGYSSKGASIIVYRNAELRSFQFFSYAEWPGGLFASPSMAGSRPGGMLAAAWTAMVAMGQNGYMEVAKKVLRAHNDILEGVAKIPGIKVLTKPDMTCIALVSDSKDVSILAVADAMERRSGWKIERQQLPDSLHFSILPQHDGVVPTLISDLAASVKEVQADPSLASKGSTGVYGMVAAIPDKSIVDEFLVKFFSTMYTVEHPGIIESYNTAIQKKKE